MTIIENRLIKKPFFSVCVPQYNRTSFLLLAIKALSAQTFTDFELCISDDNSTDERWKEIIDLLYQEKISFVYKRQEKNLRYDGNIRSSIALAQGKYSFLHGNDDCLKDINTLQFIFEKINSLNEKPGVIISNFEDYRTGKISKRILKTKHYVGTVEVAATHYRNVSFVSGVILDTAISQQVATDKWDGVEMYQMYLLGKIISSGKSLLELEDSLIRKDIHIENETVDSYASKSKIHPCPIIERHLPFTRIAALMVDALADQLTKQNRHKINYAILSQILVFTYPFWLFEYRKVQSWKFALGIALAMQPKHYLKHIPLSFFQKIRLSFYYFVISGMALIIPVSLFTKSRNFLYKIAKKSA